MTKPQMTLLTAALVATLSTGCTFTLPDPPTATVRHLPPQGRRDGGYEYQMSPFAANLASAATDFGHPTRLDLVDAAWQCEVHMSWLRERLRDDRGLELGLGISGVTVSAATGIISAALSSDEQDAKTVLAATAAAGAVIAGIGQFVASPDTLVQLYESSAAQYSKARSLAAHAPRTNGKMSQDDLAQVLDHLLACSNSTSGDGAPKPVNKEALEAAMKEAIQKVGVLPGAAGAGSPKPEGNGAGGSEGNGGKPEENKPQTDKPEAAQANATKPDANKVDPSKVPIKKPVK